MAATGESNCEVSSHVSGREVKGGASSRVSGQDNNNYLQLYAEDVHADHEHSCLTTLNWNVVDLVTNPIHVILDLVCAKPMASRHAVNQFMQAALAHVFDS